jgi:predicted TIM-barrel fold metal-dependent hydrolase
MIIDTHVHVVSGDRSAYPMLDGAPDWPVTTDDRLLADMDALGIDAAMLVQTFFTYGFDNSYAIDAAARTPDRFQVVCVIDQTAADAPDVLSDLVRNHGVRGVRLMPKGFPDGVLWDERTFPVWRRAGELGIPLTVAAEIQHLPSMPAVVARFPEVRVCFEHMWGLEIGPPPFEKVQPIFALAQFPNVSLKLAPNNSFAARDAKVPPEQFYGLLAERFGVERLMFGSNYPAHTQKFGTLADRLAIMQEDFAFLSREEQAMVFGGNALKLWPFAAPAVRG